MNRIVALLGVAASFLGLAACGTPPSESGLAPGCYTAQNGQVVCAGAAPVAAAPVPQYQLAYAPLTQARSGTYYVDVGIDGVCCFKMMLDTGASDVSVPMGLWYAMIQGGRITNDDHIDVARYRTASGVVEGLRFIMPPMQIAGVTVRGVVGSVTKGDRGSTILLGQSFLRKFRSWQINNATGQLILAY
jgi:clan AA aspartic protease (TIGR02281 family)